jgi:iron complex outermembrane receptor protein
LATAAALLLALCSPLSPAAADDQALGDLLELDLAALSALRTVTGPGRFAQKLSDAPSRVTIVTADEIRNFGYRTLAEVLRSMRGLYVSYDRSYHYLGARGFSRSGDYNTRVLILIDGIRLADPVYTQGSIGEDFPIDLELIDRVEFLPGPGSAAYGNNAFLGLVNIVTRDPGLADKAKLAIEGGSGRLAGARAEAEHRLGMENRLLLSASRSYSSGKNRYYGAFDTPGNNGGVAEGLDGESVNRFLAKLDTGRWRVEMVASARDKEVPAAPYGQVFNDPRSRISDEYLLASAQRDFELAAQTRASLQTYYTRYAYRGDYPTDYPPVTVNHDSGVGERVGLEGQIQTRHFTDHTLSAWLEVLWDPRIEQINRDLQPAFSYLDDDRSEHSWGVFLQDEIDLGRSWRLSLGLRTDRLNDGAHSTNPRLGLIHHFDEANTAKLLYGTAFRAPNAYERFYAADGFARANPDLKPERIRTVEASFEHEVRHMRLAASLFRYSVTDLIDNVIGDDDITYFTNLSEASVKGVEFEGEFRWLNGARLRASYSWQIGRNEDSGAQLSNAPRNMVKLHWSMPWRRDVVTGLEALMESGRAMEAGTRTGGYALLNANLVLSRLPGDFALSAAIYNLLDHRYDHPASIDHMQDRIAQDGRFVRLVLSHAL